MAQYYIAFDEEAFENHGYTLADFDFYGTSEAAREAGENRYPSADEIYVFCVTVDLDKTYTKTWVES